MAAFVRMTSSPALALRRLAAREPKIGSPLAVGRICAGSVELLATTEDPCESASLTRGD
jgi:hypothetical protein